MNKEQIEKAAKDFAELSLNNVYHLNNSEKEIYLLGVFTGYKGALSQPTADLDELTKDFINTFLKDATPNDIKSRQELVFSWVLSRLPHLQKPVESDAVEFAEWVNKNKLSRYELSIKWQIGKDFYTTTELYNLFKQKKD